MNQKVVIFGKSGQLGWELQQTVPEGFEAVALGLEEVDVTDEAAVHLALTRHAPDIVVNATAYTAVDKAEEEPQAAHAVNAAAPEVIAKRCAELGLRMVHVSTDFVFDGGQSTPYKPEDSPHPQSIYGATKFAGERAVLAALPNAIVVRTAWVYSVHGNNFVKTMLRLMASRPELGVVTDQVGTPTWAKGLALWIWTVLKKPEVCGIYHWTDAGVASWYDFSVAIMELAVEKGLLEKPIDVRPIPSSDYPTPAKRPASSVLDKQTAEQASGLSTQHWRQQLSLMLDELKTQ